MVHPFERTTFCLESCDDLLVVHASLEQLQGYRPTDRFRLVRFPHDTHSAFAEQASDQVSADAIALADPSSPGGRVGPLNGR
jgi:hypothetical protein